MAEEVRLAGLTERDAEIARKHGDYFRGVLAGWAGLASPPVIAEARRVLGF